MLYKESPSGSDGVSPRGKKQSAIAKVRAGIMRVTSVHNLAVPTIGNNEVIKTASSQRQSQSRRRSSTVTMAELTSAFADTEIRQRISSSNVFRDGYDLSPDIEERLTRYICWALDGA